MLGLTFLLIVGALVVTPGSVASHGIAPSVNRASPWARTLRSTPESGRGVRPDAGPSFWSNVSGLGVLAPGPTYGGSIAFDPALNTTILLTYNSSFSTGWEYDYRNYNWTNPTKAVAQQSAGLGYDPSDNELIAFGGGAPIPHETGLTIPTNATWARTASGWTNLTSGLGRSPPPTDQPILTSDPGANGVLLIDPVGPVNASQTWLFSNGSWTNLTSSAGTPPPGPAGADSVLAYDPALNAVVFFGGSLPGPGYANATNQTWEFSDGQWTRNLTSGPPIPTGTVQVMAYDNLTGELIDLIAPPYLYAANGTVSYLQWDFGPAGWVNATASLPATPDVGYDPLAVWDGADNDLLYLSGGYDAQTWIFGSTPLGASLEVDPSSIDLGNTSTLTTLPTGGAPPYQYRYSGLPTGCESLDVAVVPCRPTVDGTFELTVTVTDTLDAVVNATAILTVGEALQVQGPLAPAYSYVGATVPFSVNVSGGQPPYVAAWTVGLPGCAPGNVLAFECTANATGVWPVSVNVTDASGGPGIVVTMNLSVVPRLDLLAFVVTPTSAEVGTELTVNVTVLGGIPPLTFDYSGLPTGCVSANASLFNCRPSAPGTFSVAVAVTDRVGGLTKATANVSVSSRLQVTDFEIQPNPALPGGQVTFGYLIAGGSPPYTSVWTGLPTGCASASGNFSCTMESAGTFNLTLTVRDSLGVEATANGTLVVSTPAPGSGGTATLGTSTEELAAALAVAAVAIVGVFAWARRRGGTTPTDRADAPSDSAEEPGSDGGPGSGSG